MIYLPGQGPDTEAREGYIDQETGYDLTQPLGLQQRIWDSPEDRALLVRLQDRRAEAGLPEIDDRIVRAKVDENKPTEVTQRSEPAKTVARHKGAKKPARGRGRQVKSASARAASLHGDLETN